MWRDDAWLFHVLGSIHVVRCGEWPCVPYVGDPLFPWHTFPAPPASRVAPTVGISLLLQLLAVYIASTSSTVMGRRATSAWMAANRASMVMAAQVSYQTMNRCCICNWGVPLIVVPVPDDDGVTLRVILILVGAFVMAAMCALGALYCSGAWGQSTQPVVPKNPIAGASAPALRATLAKRPTRAATAHVMRV